MILKTDLILRVEKFQLIVDEAVLGRLFLSERSFLLQLRTPEGLDTMHTGTKLLVGQLQFLLQVSQFPLEIGVLVLEFTDVAAPGVPTEMGVGGLASGSRAVQFILQVHGTVQRAVSGGGTFERTLPGLPYRHELSVMNTLTPSTVEGLVTDRDRVVRRPGGAPRTVVPSGSPTVLHHRTLDLLLPSGPTVVGRTHLVARMLLRRGRSSPPTLPAHRASSGSDRGRVVSGRRTVDGRQLAQTPRTPRRPVPSCPAQRRGPVRVSGHGSPLASPPVSMSHTRYAPRTPSLATRLGRPVICRCSRCTPAPAYYDLINEHTLDTYFNCPLCSHSTTTSVTTILGLSLIQNSPLTHARPRSSQ